MKGQVGRWPYQNLVDFVGGDLPNIIAHRIGVTTSCLYRWRQSDRLFSDVEADRIANAIGCHPWEIWPDWFD